MLYGNVVSVKFKSPTDTKGARVVASIKHGGMTHDVTKTVTMSMGGGRPPREIAHAAAKACLELNFEGTEHDALAYGDYSSSEWVFIF